MTTIRILIVNTQSLLIGVTENYLKNNTNFAVINAYSRDMHTLSSEIEQAQPDVIVMDEDTFFSEPLRLLTSLCGLSKIRLIVLNNQRTLVNIYDKHVLAISNPGQLIETIQSDRKVFTAE